MVKRSRGRWSLIKRRSSFSSFLRGSDPMASMERGLLSSECLIITRMTYFMSTQELLYVQTSRCSRSCIFISPNNLWIPLWTTKTVWLKLLVYISPVRIVQVT